jgi:hypothetical protein
VGGLLAWCSLDSVSLWCRVVWGTPSAHQHQVVVGYELGGRGWLEGDSAEEVFEGEHDGGH